MEKQSEREAIRERLDELKVDREVAVALYKKASSEQAKDACYRLWQLCADSYDYLYEELYAL